MLAVAYLFSHRFGKRAGCLTKHALDAGVRCGSLPPCSPRKDKDKTMKFHYGAPPEATDFQPEQEGWNSIHELGTTAMQFVAIPVAILIIVVVGGLLLLCFPQEIKPSYISYDPILKMEVYSITIPLLLTGFAIAMLVIPIHELVHALFHPGFGFSDKTIIGAWLTKGLFYAGYQDEMTRNRYLIVFVAPFIALSLIPIAILAFSQNLSFISPDLRIALAAFSLLAGVGAAGDFVSFFLLISQVPNSAMVRNKGWKTYWKPVK